MVSEKQTVSVGPSIYFYVSAMILLAVSVRYVGLRKASFTLSSLLFLLTFISPSSAICLVDWQWGASFKMRPAGIKRSTRKYGGRWNWSVISIYFIGLLMELPLFPVVLHWSGIASLLDGADISWLDWPDWHRHSAIQHLQQNVLLASMKIQA